MSYQNPKYINDMEAALSKAASGLDQPPCVAVNVDWIEVTTMNDDGRQWRAMITYKVTAEIDMETV